MKYPALGIIAIFLRSLAETVDKHNSGELDEQDDPDMQAEPLHGKVSVPAKTTRTRRTKEQIAADEKAAAEAKAGAEIQEEMKKHDAEKPKEEQAPAPSGPSAEDLYQERRSAFDWLIKNNHIDKVKEVLRKYTDSPNANRDLPAEHHEAFLKDIKALTESIAL